jgi:hypothetical protein
MKDVVIELEFTEAERSAIQGRLTQKVNEALNPNLAHQNGRKIELCAELFELCLTREGKLWLLWQHPRVVRIREIILEKIADFAPLNVARTNEAYLAAADALKNLIEEINKGGLPACYMAYVQE